MFDQWRGKDGAMIPAGLPGSCVVVLADRCRDEHGKAAGPAAKPFDNDSHPHHHLLQNQKFLLKSENSQNFQLWNVLPVRQLWDQRPHWLRLSTPSCHGDHHVFDRIANVLTSIPFILIGLQAPRNRFAHKLYADSVIGVGLASGMYHSSKGNARSKIMLVGTDIQRSPLIFELLSRALRKDDSKMLYVASAALLPMQPLLVSALHVGLMEVTFAQRAHMEPHLRNAHSLHVASSLAACALFVADDMFPDVPFLHAAWHVAAAIGTATCIKLLQ